MESGVPFRYNHLGEGKPFKVKLDPTLAAFAVILTIVLCVKLFVSGLERPRFKLAALAFLVAFVWINVSLNSSKMSDGQESFRHRPIQNVFLQSHARGVLFVVMIAWGLIFYWRFTAND